MSGRRARMVVACGAFEARELVRFGIAPAPRDARGWSRLRRKEMRTARCVDEALRRMIRRNALWGMRTEFAMSRAAVVLSEASALLASLSDEQSGGAR